MPCASQGVAWQPVCKPAAANRKRCRLHVVPPRSEDVVDVAVVGAGAAGLSAAHWAAVSGATVTVLEKNSEAGKKILISGGARCNVLPLSVDIAADFFTESSPSALRAVFSTWSLEECRHWLEDGRQVGIPLALEAATGKLFPASNSAAEVRQRLVAACERHGARLAYGAALAGMQRRPDDGRWLLTLGDGRSLAAKRVVLATGGLSFPALGTTGDGFRLLQRLGHDLHPPYAALTPLLGSHPGGQQLAGVTLPEARLEAVASAALAGGGEAVGAGPPVAGKKRGGGKGAAAAGAGATAQRSSLLFTHRGFSGPAVLDLSHLVVRALERGQLPPPRIRVGWAGGDAAAWERRLLEGGPTLAPNLLRREGVPQRLAEALCAEAGVPLDRKLSELRRGEREALVAALARFELAVTGHEGYGKAEVTGGGVPLNQLDCATLESRLAPGVHVCGELCDVFGRIGGFNFYWAWLSGRLAGLAAAEAAAAAG